MQTADFDFELPRHLIAQQPASPRDASRLLQVADPLRDRRMLDLPDLLSPGDLLVVNDTKVLPAQLTARRGTAKVSLTLHRQEEEYLWRAFAKPVRRLKAGDTMTFGPGFEGRVMDIMDEGEIRLRLQAADGDSRSALGRHGAMPLPPYIKRPGGKSEDSTDYQTVFATRDGAVAAPTAGLHFSDRLLKALEARGIGRVAVTLHVGAGTFLPVRSEDPREHRMHGEWGEIRPDAAVAVNRTREDGGRIVAVGSTSLRLLEAAARPDGTVAPFAGETDLFILPGYRFRVVDRMLTNFHLPRSTLIMLVSAFAGTERIKAAYAHAIAAGYRFYSYGDGCLLERSDP